MPIYEYKCLECEHEFEMLRKMNDHGSVICEACSSVHTEQLLSLSSFQLKGSGWAHDSYGVSASSNHVASDSDS